MSLPQTDHVKILLSANTVPLFPTPDLNGLAAVHVFTVECRHISKEATVKTIRHATRLWIGLGIVVVLGILITLIVLYGGGSGGGGGGY